jgi:subtilase family serine protease
MLKGWVRVLAILAVLSILVTAGPASSQVNPGKAELHPDFLILDPASPIDQGRLVNISLLLENTGTATANQFHVEFFIRLHSDSTAGSWTSFAIDEISGLSSVEQQIEARAVLDSSDSSLIPAPGIYEIRAVVDSNNQIPELDETNNEMITSAIIQSSRLGLPDLRAKSLAFDPTSPVEQDTKVEVMGTVSNDGDQKAAPFSVELAYCKINSLVNPTTCPSDFTQFALVEDAFLGGLTKGGELEARASLPALEPGTYLIRMRVDPPTSHNPAGMIDEQDEANNELIVIFAIQGSELHVPGITYTPELPRVGDTVTISATVENSGQVKCSNAEVAFFVDGAQFDLKTVTLVGGQSDVVQGVLNTSQFNLDAGVHTIRVIVDPKNLVSERDETNNETRTGITLQTALPTLAELRPKGILLNPSSPIQLGSNSNITVSTEILNTGPVAASNVTVEFSYRSTGSVRWVPILCTTNCNTSTLESGARFVASANLFLFNLTPGAYEVQAVVDPQNTIPELDEFNNTIQSAFTLLANRIPDLLVDPASVQFTPSLTERRGTPITLNADVVNFGEADAIGPFDVDVSLAHLNSDGTLGQAVSLNSVQISGLSVGNRQRISVVLNTANILPGIYQVLINVDPQNRIAELDENNNLLLTGPLFLRGPDLTGTPRYIDPTVNIFEPRIGVGTKLTVAVDVTNIGVEAAGEFDVGFCHQALVNNVEQGSCVSFGDTTHFPGLGIGSIVTVSTTYDTSGLAAGRYELKAVIDPASPNFPVGHVEEENETNNTPALTFEIVGAGGSTTGSTSSGIDLTVQNVTVDPNLTWFGDTVAVKAQIANIGIQGAGSFRVVFFYKKIGQGQMFNFAQFTVNKMDAGEVQSLTAQLKTTLLGFGDYQIIVLVDFNNDVKESNESNNRGSAQLTVT